MMNAPVLDVTFATMQQTREKTLIIYSEMHRGFCMIFIPFAWGVVTRKARRRISGNLSADFTCTDIFVTGSYRRAQYNYVSTPQPSPVRGTSIVKTMTGNYEISDSTFAGSVHMAPVPDGC